MRGDLPPGLQFAQVAHVATEYALRHREWSGSTPIGVVLEVPDEETLLAYADAVSEGIPPFTLFHEEDLDGEATTLATVSTGEMFSSLPLAGRSMATV